MFKVVKNEAILADRENSDKKEKKEYLKIGGLYHGKITHSTIRVNDLSQILEIEIEATNGESTGKQFFTLVTKGGLTVDVRGNCLLGRSQISALCSLLEIDNLENGIELENKEISFLGCMRNSYSTKHSKNYYNFNILNFMDAKTLQTYSEKQKGEAAKKAYTKVIDEPESSEIQF